MSEADKRATPEGDRHGTPTPESRDSRPALERKADAAALGAAGLAGLPGLPGPAIPGLLGSPGPLSSIGPLGFSGTTGAAAANADAMASLLHDVPLEVSVELGRVRLPLGELAARLTPGSVIALDKLSGALLDVRVQSRLIARAEAVAIGERCGIRILELVGGNDS